MDFGKHYQMLTPGVVYQPDSFRLYIVPEVCARSKGLGENWTEERLLGFVSGILAAFARDMPGKVIRDVRILHGKESGYVPDVPQFKGFEG